MAIPKSGVQLGGDPEFFVRNVKTGDIVPSCGLIGGDKGSGLEVGPGVRWLEDNVSVELNFDPIQDGEMFGWTLANSYMPFLVHELEKRNLSPVFVPSHTFKVEDLVHPKAMTFGCEPDFCAYDVDTKKPRDVDSMGFKMERFCGGHLHLAFNNRDDIPIWAIAMLMDAYVGLPMVCVEKQGSRRASYGLAGLYRPKPYGIEYRVLSNFWLEQAWLLWTKNEGSSINTRNVWLNHFAMSVMSLGRSIETDPMTVSKLFTRLPWKDIQRAINTEDHIQAKELYTYCKSVQEVRQLSLFARIFNPNE